MGKEKKASAKKADMKNGGKTGHDGNPVTSTNPPISIATQFKKGNPGGPGVPKGRRLSTILGKSLSSEIAIKKHPLTKKTIKTISVEELIVCKMLIKAMNGNDKSIDQVFDRIEGKASQPLEHTGITQLPDLSHLSVEDLRKLIFSV